MSNPVSALLGVIERHRKIGQSLPLLAMMAILAVEEVVVYYLQPQEGLWPLAAFAFPLTVGFWLDRQFRARFDWYPYSTDDLEPADGSCPRCESDEYYVERGRIDVHRCLECGSEGAKAR